MRVEFSWEPEAADRRDTLRAVAPAVRWAPAFAVCLVVLAAVLLLADNTSAAVFSLVAAGAVAIGVPWQARLLYRDTLSASQRVRATADEFALRMHGMGLPDELAWSSLQSWQETDHGIVLRLGARAHGPVYAVPHRAFALPADEHMFRELLIRRVGPTG
ncbi:MAG TPA: YcxB family protein [Kutzneria sp.]